MREAAGSAILRDPAEFLAADRSGVEAYPELLVEQAAMLAWRGKPQGEVAMQRLADLLWSRHGDAWLRDYLSRPASGARALSKAVRANAAGEYEPALAAAVEAARLFREDGNLAGFLRAERERVYALQRTAKGPECLARAAGPERRLRTLPYPWLRGQLALEISACRNAEGQIGASVGAAARVLDNARRAGYRSLQLRATSFVAGFQADLGDLDGLWSLTLDALELYWSGPYRGLRGYNLLLNLSVAAEKAGQPYAACAFQRESVVVLESDENMLQKALAHSNLASAALAAGEAETARQEYAAAENLFGQLPDKKTGEEYKTEAVLLRATTLLGTRPDGVLQELTAMRHEWKRMPTLPLEAKFQQTLGLAYQRLGRHDDAEMAFTAAVRDTEEWASSIRSAQRRTGALRSVGESYRALVSARIARYGDWEGALSMWERSRGGGETGPPVEPETGTFVVFALLPDGPVAWVLEGGRLHGHRLEVSTPELERMASAFLRQCADPSSSDQVWKQSARRLYEWLLAPLERWFTQAHTLIVEPDGALAGIPMAALVDGAGRFAGDRFSVAVADNIDAYRTRARRGPAAISLDVRALVLTDPLLRGATRRLYPPFEDPGREAAEVKRRFPRAKVFAGDAATAEVLTRLGPSVQLLHFAGHGISNAGAGALLLAPGLEGEAEILQASRLSGQDWSRCELVVLSACSTSAVQPRGEVNPEALVGGFLAAGARRVIASRWRVDSRATAEFMEALYGALGRGMEPSAAASAAAAPARTRGAHPYRWAGFDTFGFR